MAESTGHPAPPYPLARPQPGATRYLIVPYRAGTAHRLPPEFRLSLGTIARHCGVHPDLVRRFVALGLLDAGHDVTGEPWFTAAAPADIARIQRLHAGLCLNYAAIGVVMDLLDRIDALERALRTGTPEPRGAGWAVVSRRGSRRARRNPPAGARPDRTGNAAQPTTSPQSRESRSRRPWT
jgi:chaperone modulatory protein CbpM